MIGVISDTHGLIRRSALEVLNGVDVILHSGDIGNITVLRAFWKVAPVIAVRGNCDRGDWIDKIPERCYFVIGNHRFLIIHKLQDMQNPLTPLDVVVFGHSHQSNIFVKDNILYLNPGSAGPKRFKLPVTVARIRIDKGNLIPKIIKLI